MNAWNKAKYYMIGFVYYCTGKVMLNTGEDGCFKSQCYFLIAHDCFSKVGPSLKEKCSEYLSMVEAIEKESVKRLEDFFSPMKAGQIPYERALVKCGGDERKLNIPLFFNVPGVVILT